MKSLAIYLIVLFLTATVYGCSKGGHAGYNYGSHKKRNAKHVKTIGKPQSSIFKHDDRCGCI